MANKEHWELIFTHDQDILINSLNNLHLFTSFLRTGAGREGGMVTFKERSRKVSIFFLFIVIGIFS